MIKLVKSAMVASAVLTAAVAIAGEAPAGDHRISTAKVPTPHVPVAVKGGGLNPPSRRLVQPIRNSGALPPWRDGKINCDIRIC